MQLKRGLLGGMSRSEAFKYCAPAPGGLKGPACICTLSSASFLPGSLSQLGTVSRMSLGSICRVTPLEDSCGLSRPKTQWTQGLSGESGARETVERRHLFLLFPGVSIPSPKFSNQRCEERKMWRPLSLDGFVVFETGLRVVQVCLRFTL